MTGEAGYSSIFKDYGDKKTITSVAILIGVMTLSGVLYSYLLADLLTSQLSSAAGVTIFGALTLVVFVFGYYFLTNITRHKAPKKVSLMQSTFFFRAVKTVFLASAAVHAIIFLEIAFTSRYHTVLSMGTMSTSFLLGSSIVGLLSFRFLSWFGSKHDPMLLLYGLSYAAVAIGLTMIAVANLGVLLLTDPAQQQGADIDNADRGVNAKLRGPIYSSTFLITLIPGRISFALYWAATALLLRNYARYMGKVRFWATISVPIFIYVIATVLTFTNYANSQFLRAILTLVSLVIGGLFFSIIFLTTARNLKQMNHEAIAHYLTLSGFGVFLFVVSTTSPVHLVDWAHIPYPPIASSVWSFASVAAYLYAFGVFFAATAISRDIQLRKSIKKIAIREPQLFGSIGTAAMEHELSTRIRNLIKEQEHNLEEQSNEPPELTEVEVKSYIEETMEEIRRAQHKN